MDRKRILLTICAVLFSVLLCLTLYRYDNKYTHPATQPISGVLILSEQDLTDNPVRYLVREWELYPGVLLSPGETAGVYRYFVDIGRTGDFPQGSGTYRLRITLPPEPRDYAIELPEIFSACRLYIGEREMLALGVPEADVYREGIGSRIVNFTAADSVELLLAVSDFSGLYSGLTYPPAFGTAQAVASARENRMLLHSALVLLALFGVIFSASFAIRGNRLRGILMLLCCLCFGVSTGYPLYHGVLITGYLPLYPLELVCLYAIWMLALLLYGNLCGLRNRTLFWLAVPSALGVLLAGLRGLAAALWTMESASVFSLFSLGFKYYAAAVLLGLSVWALLNRLKYAAPLFCGAVGLAVFLIFDRLLPLYEPIYGGWLNEVGGGVLVLFLATALWQDALSAYRFRLAYEQDYLQMERQMSLQKEHYRQMSEQIEKSRALAHDLRHHARVLRHFANRGESAEILKYLNAYDSHVLEGEVTTYSDHLAADAVLRHYAATAKTLGADYDVRLPLPPDLDFPSDELCILLGNLLENAMEALSRQDTGRRMLYLRGEAQDGELRLVVNNSFDGHIRKHGDVFISRKREGFGLGVLSVTRIVESHGGLCRFAHEGRQFRVSLLIPLPREDVRKRQEQKKHLVGIGARESQGNE